ncbi:hypothetical protein Bhyg_04542, partial [Pseudolycoriella hygida]
RDICRDISNISNCARLKLLSSSGPTSFQVFNIIEKKMRFFALILVVAVVMPFVVSEIDIEELLVKFQPL